MSRLSTPFRTTRGLSPAGLSRWSPRVCPLKSSSTTSSGFRSHRVLGYSHLGCCLRRSCTLRTLGARSRRVLAGSREQSRNSDGWIRPVRSLATRLGSPPLGSSSILTESGGRMRCLISRGADRRVRIHSLRIRRCSGRSIHRSHPSLAVPNRHLERFESQRVLHRRRNRGRVPRFVPKSAVWASR